MVKIKIVVLGSDNIRLLAGLELLFLETDSKYWCKKFHHLKELILWDNPTAQ